MEIKTTTHYIRCRSKILVSIYVGTMKGRTAIRAFNRFRHLKRKPYWGNHF